MDSESKLPSQNLPMVRNETIYNESKDTVPYRSRGRPFNIHGGYPAKSRVCMPCEPTDGRMKENGRMAFQMLRKVSET